MLLFYWIKTSISPRYLPRTSPPTWVYPGTDQKNLVKIEAEIPILQICYSFIGLKPPFPPDISLNLSLNLGLPQDPPKKNCYSFIWLKPPPPSDMPSEPLPLTWVDPRTHQKKFG